MPSKKDISAWPKAYDAPKLYHIETEFQQALGITYCTNGLSAGGGTGSCGAGNDASGTPDQPNACSGGSSAMTGPGHGNSPCGQGLSACATG